MHDDEVFKALRAQDAATQREKRAYDAHLHPEEMPAPKAGLFRIAVPEGIFQLDEAKFHMWLDYQIDGLRSDIIRARKRWL